MPSTRSEIVEKTELQPLPHTLAAPALARRYVTSVSVPWSADMLEVALLLTSELVANAVLHGLGPIGLLLDDDGERLRVEVSDGEPVLPPKPGTPGARRERPWSGHR